MMRSRGRSTSVVRARRLRGRLRWGLFVALLVAALVATPLLPARTSAGALGSGYWRAKGSLIVDGGGRPVRVAGLSWFGFETTTFSPHGLRERSYRDLLGQVASRGYNLVRIPYSNQMLDPASRAAGIDFGKNPELVGLTPVQILDRIVERAGALGLKVLLDRHRPDAASQSALWYTDAYPESRWIADWRALAKRYAGNPTVIGADLHNEPHDPACWGCGDQSRDWRLAAERAGNAILGVNRKWLVFVEGVDNHAGTWNWWGGNLAGARAHPVRLRVGGRLVYSPHDYPASIYPQPWFADPSYPANLPAFWDSQWGYLQREGIAPVVLGEFGSKLETFSDRTWFDTLVRYLCPTRECGATGFGWALWSLNPSSGDTGGLLRDDWTTIDAVKDSGLEPLKFRLGTMGAAAARTASPG